MERPTSGVGPDGGLANEPRKNRAGRQATGILKLNEPVPGVLLPCSLTVLSCEARRRRGIARAIALFPAYSPSYTGASRVRLSFLSRQKPSRSLPHAPLESRRRSCRRAPRRRRRASAGPRRAAEPGAGPALLRGGREGLWRPRRAPPAERGDGRVHAPLLRRRRPRRPGRPGSAGRLPGPRPAFARLRRRRRRERARRHEPPRRRGHDRGQDRARRQARVRGDDRAQRSAHRPRGAVGERRAAAARARVRRLGGPAGRRPRARHRQPLRRRPDGDARHGLGARPHPGRGLGLPVLHPDRRLYQSGQFRRRPRRHRRPARRHQHGDLLALGRQPRHRLRHPLEHGADRGRIGEGRQPHGAQPVARRPPPERRARHRRFDGPRAPDRGARRLDLRQEPGRGGGAQARRPHPCGRRPGRRYAGELRLPVLAQGGCRADEPHRAARRRAQDRGDPADDAARDPAARAGAGQGALAARRRDGRQHVAGRRRRAPARHLLGGRRGDRHRTELERHAGRLPEGRRDPRHQPRAGEDLEGRRARRQGRRLALGDHHQSRRPDADDGAARLSDLFAAAGLDQSAPRPLADRLRPTKLSDVVGQDHLVGPDGALTRLPRSGSLGSLVFWGPPGTGKTTVARLLANETDLHFEQISAIFSGVADLKKVFEAARGRRATGQGTLLLVDEIHRFNRTQLDAFLPVTEDGFITLVGATTENPSFELNAALLSRARVMIFKALDEAALEKLLDAAEEVLRKPLPLTQEARASLVRMSDGDGRAALSLAEEVWRAAGEGEIFDAETLQDIVQRRAPIYDKAQEGHYNLISALHKTIRGSDPDAALYYLARMLDAGEDPLYIARRLVRAASEDIGMADPQALGVANAAKDAFDFLGSPEGELALAQATIYLATAPKSNAAYTAYGAARRIAKEHGSLMPPKTILNAPTKLMKSIGYGSGYAYDHDAPEAFSGQDYWPEALGRQRFYAPSERGFEREVRKRLEWWQKLRRERGGEGGDA